MKCPKEKCANYRKDNRKKCVLLCLRRPKVQDKYKQKES